MPTTGGSRSMASVVPVEHANVVRRYLEAGLVVFGKTNLPEFALKAVTNSTLFGRANNPWDFDRTPGGSSGGAAAAVAAGIVPMAAANDGGGSIRIPAACCGLFGLKPSRGRASLGPAAGEVWRGHRDVRLDHRLEPGHPPSDRRPARAGQALGSLQPGSRGDLAHRLQPQFRGPRQRRHDLRNLSGGLTPYFNTYLWGLGTKQIGTIQLSALISALPAVILAPILARRFGKKRVCITLFFIAILTLAAPISGKLLGLTPPSGSTALVFFLAANHMLVSGLSMMGFIIVTSMIADIVEETELRTGRRSEGLLFAADTFLQKVSTGVATFLPGLMVTYVGLPVHARPKTLDPAIMIHLATLYLPMAIGLMLCSTTCIFFYRIRPGPA